MAALFTRGENLKLTHKSIKGNEIVIVLCSNHEAIKKDEVDLHVPRWQYLTSTDKWKKWNARHYACL